MIFTGTADADDTAVIMNRGREIKRAFLFAIANAAILAVHSGIKRYPTVQRTVVGGGDHKISTVQIGRIICFFYISNFTFRMKLLDLRQRVEGYNTDGAWVRAKGQDTAQRNGTSSNDRDAAGG
jgi:hypothetical protein